MTATQTATRVSAPPAPLIARSRVRSLDLETPRDATIDTPVKIAALATALAKAKAEESLAASATKKAEKALKEAILADKLEGKLYTVAVGNDKFDFGIVEGEKEEVDVQKLKAEVSDNIFWAVLKANKGDVEKMAGEVVVSKVMRTVPTPASFSFKKKR